MKNAEEKSCVYDMTLSIQYAKFYEQRLEKTRKIKMADVVLNTFLSFIVHVF